MQAVCYFLSFVANHEQPFGERMYASGLEQSMPLPHVLLGCCHTGDCCVLGCDDDVFLIMVLLQCGREWCMTLSR